MWPLGLIYCLAALFVLVTGTGVSDPDLTGLWPLTRATGARDVSPYERDAKLENNTTYKNGDCGVLQVRKNGGSVTIDQLPEERGNSGSFTVAMWIRVHKKETYTHEPILAWKGKDGKTVFEITRYAKHLLYWRGGFCGGDNKMAMPIFSELKAGLWTKIAVVYDGGIYLCFQIDGSSCRYRYAPHFGTFSDSGFTIGKVQEGCHNVNPLTPLFDLFCLQVWRTALITTDSSPGIKAHSFNSTSEPCYKWNPNVCQLKSNDSGNGHSPAATIWPSSTRSTSNSNTHTSSISSTSTSSSSSSIIIANSTNSSTDGRVDNSRKPSWQAVAYAFLVAAVIAFVAVALCAIL